MCKRSRQNLRQFNHPQKRPFIDDILTKKSGDDTTKDYSLQIPVIMYEKISG